MAQLEVIQAQRKKTFIEDYETPYNICVYCRVSTDKEDQKNSLDSQSVYFDRFFAQHPNWNKVGVFVDEGLSGTTTERREQFNKMISIAKSGGIDIILTKDVSRFSRNTEDALRIAKELRQRNVYVCFWVDDINTQKNDYQTVLSEMATNAQRESARTSLRVRWGQEEQMRKGIVFGRKEMYGYNIVRVGNRQEFVKKDDEVETIRNIFKWFASGDGTHTIARRLEKQGVKTQRYKNGWSNTVILRILRNEKYVGDLLQGKTYTPDYVDHKKKYNHNESNMYYIKDHHKDSAIIDRELWDKVQSILEEKAPTAEIKAKHSNRYWTSGKIYCGLCGSRYVSYQKKQKNTPYKAWVCFENHSRGQYKQLLLDTGETAVVGCNALRVNDRVLKTALYDIITQYVKPQRQAIIASLQAELEKEIKPKDHSKEIAKTEKAIEKSKQTIVNLSLMRASGEIDEEAYSLSVPQAQENLFKLRARLAELKNDVADVENINILKNRIEQVKSILDFSDEDINEGLYERITKKIVVYPLNILEIHLSFLTKPLYLQYRASGKGDFYKIEFDLLSVEQFNELMQTAPRNEIKELIE